MRCWPIWNRPEVRPVWRYLKHPRRVRDQLLGLRRRDITTETLEELWLTDADATVLTIRLTIAEVRGRRVGVGALPQRQAPAQRGFQRTEPADRTPIGRGARQPAGADVSPPSAVPSRTLHDGDEIVLSGWPVRRAARRA